jgi:kumamolisin
MNRPVARRHSSRPRAVNDGARPFNGAELAKIYNFPQGTDGTGQTIGIIELGGGYQPSDLDTYFSSLGLSTPTVIPVSVDGGTNSPSSANSDDAEVVLDIQVAGAAAPGVKFVVYFAPNDAASNGFMDALSKAVQDTENSPSIISTAFPPHSPPTVFCLCSNDSSVSGRRRRADALASVRRSNCTCRFPAYSFHEDSIVSKYQ